MELSEDALLLGSMNLEELLDLWNGEDKSDDPHLIELRRRLGWEPGGPS